MDVLSRIAQTKGPDLFRMDGRVALVTGAAGRLGRSMACGLAEAGAHVVLNGRRPEALEDLAGSLRRRGLAASALAFDVTDAQAVDQAVRVLGQQFQRLDVLVNNAYAGPAGSVDHSRAEEFARAYDVAVIASFRLMVSVRHLLLQAVARCGHASVINIASMYATVSPDPSVYGDSGMDNPPYYGAAKGALLQLTRYMACHWAPSGIRVNAISPGPFPQPAVLCRYPTFHRALCSRTPAGRVGMPDELKGAVLYLASDAASYVTGINLPVDGGWTAW